MSFFQNIKTKLNEMGSGSENDQDLLFKKDKEEVSEQDVKRYSSVLKKISNKSKFGEDNNFGNREVKGRQSVQVQKQMLYGDIGGNEDSVNFDNFDMFGSNPQKSTNSEKKDGERKMTALERIKERKRLAALKKEKENALYNIDKQ